MIESSAADSFGKIAVIGMSGRYPNAWNVAQFWDNLKEGRECITFFTDEELLEAGVSPELIARRNYVKASGTSPGAFLFDAPFFGYTPREAEFLDPQHRVFLECAWEALEHAGYDAGTYPGRIGLFAGSGATQYLFELLSIPEIHKLADAFTLSVCGDKDFLATRVGYKLNLRGPCISIQTACSTSLVSIVMACQSLLSYQSDIAMGGGVTLLTRERQGYLYQDGGIHSPDGHCRAFDAEARGIAGGTGAGIVVLKRLDDALADQDTIHAVILGTGLNNDGSARIGFSAPGVNGQIAVSSDAIAMAGINPETIGFVECHGTATPVGDPIEITALTRSFQAYTQKKNFCAVGSVKTNIGHADTAAGVAGFTKAVLSLKNKLIPANLHFSKPNPDIDFANSPFYVNAKLQEWKREETPRRAGVSSFGLGGTNAHVILEEAPEQAALPDAEWNLLLWSARTESALEKMSGNLLKHLQDNPEDSISDVAYTLQAGRQLFPYRRMLVCRDRHDAIGALETHVPDRLLMGHREKGAGPVTFLFSGQGSQYVNMGKKLYGGERVFREQIDLCAEMLKPELGLDLREILYPASESSNTSELIDQTRYTSPILFAVEYAQAKLWMAWGINPAAVIGHSLGEYAAACIAGVFSLEDALRLVSARGRLIQQLPAGCMTGVLLPEAQLAPLLASVSGISLAAVNGVSACVVSGDEKPMVELERMLAEKAALYRRLHISHAFHSSMVDSMLEDFRKEAKKIKLYPARIPYVSNVSGTWIDAEDVADPDYWVRHLRQPVRFADGLTEILKDPQRILLEVGPGRTLSSLAAQHPSRGVEHVILSSLPHPKDDLQGDQEFILRTAAQLWLEGAKFDWKKFHSGKPRRRIPLPTYPFERQHYQLKGKLGSQPRIELDNASASLPTQEGHPIAANGKHSVEPIGTAHRRPNLPVAYLGPRNELETAIAKIWQDTLGIDGPGINDTFFALGGHSLSALQVVTRVRDSFEIEFAIADLYQSPTIAGLAESVVRLLIGNTDSETLEMLIDVVDDVPEKQRVS